MHYYIDGYNLLFRLVRSAHDDLQGNREKIIRDLNKKISLLNWDVSIVFDSQFVLGEGTRSHFDALEIHFTNYGETADEYILYALKDNHETVVTSDNWLASRARKRHAKTLTVEEFIDFLNRSYKNKVKAKQKMKKLPPTIQLKNRLHEYYLKIFEQRLKDMDQG